jgi:hypothetical protein
VRLKALVGPNTPMGAKGAHRDIHQVRYRDQLTEAVRTADRWLAAQIAAWVRFFA